MSCPPAKAQRCPHSEQGLTSLRLSTTTKCRSPRARKSLNTRGRDASCKAGQGCVGCSPSSWHPHLPCPQVLGVQKVVGQYLRHGVGRGVHELAEVNHALALILGDVDGLDRGEARVGVPKVLQLQPALHQAQVGSFHKNLRRKETTMDRPAVPTGTRAREGSQQENGAIRCYSPSQSLQAWWGAG